MEKPNLENFKLNVGLQLRFRDTDALGHVNNAVYLSYLELARIKYVEKLFPSAEWTQVSFILAKVEIDYLSPITLKDCLTIGIRCTRLHKASFDFEYAIWANKERALKTLAKTVQVMYDYQKGRVIRIPDYFRSTIAAFEKFHAET